ncbi:MAG TPA: hypothetical protein DCR97_10630 [Deltaproteobacteria bacterium]|nr:hypothetical protein [Deltaproteobacteria bacterium]
MDLAQIAEMKNKIIEELREIDVLKRSMENTLTGLIEWEKHLQSRANASPKRATRKASGVTGIETKPQAAVKAKPVTPGKRVDRALATMSGEFTRSELLAETAADGKGDIPGKTYSHIFSRLLKKQHIECVKGSPSQRDSLYVRSDGKKRDEVAVQA